MEWHDGSSLRSRWSVLATALIVETVGGLFYMFGVFSNDLKHRFLEGTSDPQFALQTECLGLSGLTIRR